MLTVVIRSQICIFDLLNTAHLFNSRLQGVVIRSQICIFDLLNTASPSDKLTEELL